MTYIVEKCVFKLREIKFSSRQVDITKYCPSIKLPSLFRHHEQGHFSTMFLSSARQHYHLNSCTLLTNHKFEFPNTENEVAAQEFEISNL
jgi:hypothetical protein